MPGAIIVTDQPTGAGAGSPGVSRNDLWRTRPVNLSVGVGGNTSYLWELVDRPAGSAAALTSTSSATSQFTPDVWGTYRVRLTTNGGGPGNVQTLAFRARYSSTGVLTYRGWALPGYGERAGEDNAGGNTRGYAGLFEFFLTDIAQYLEARLANSLVPDISGTARISADLIQNESDSKAVVRSACGHTSTTTATPVAAPLVILDAGDVLSVDVFVTVRNSAGTVAGRWRLSALAIQQAGVASFVGGATADPDPKKTDVGLDVALVVSGDEVHLQLTPLAANLTWGWEVRYQDMVF